MAQSIWTRKCHIYILQTTYKIRNTKSVLKGSDDAHFTQLDYQVPGLCPSSNTQTTSHFRNCINTFAMWGRVAPSSVRLKTSDNICMSTDSKHLNPLNAELNPICHLLALLGVHFLHVSRIRVKSLTLMLIMSYIYIYGAPILDVSRSHTTTHHSR
jgi:hypothetical protein